MNKLVINALIRVGLWLLLCATLLLAAALARPRTADGVGTSKSTSFESWRAVIVAQIAHLFALVKVNTAARRRSCTVVHAILQG